MTEDNTTKDTSEMRQTGQKKKKIIITVAAVLIVYLLISFYFMSHFFFGTKINGYKSQMKKPEDVKEYMTAYGNDYEVTLKERQGKEEVIHSGDMNLKFMDDGRIEAIKEGQNGFLWIAALWQDHDYNVELFSYDEAALKAKYDSLTCFDKENIIEPVSAYPEYDKTKKEYVIINEIEGTRVQKKKLYDRIKTAIQKKETVIDLDKEDCYRNPDYYRDHETVIAAKDEMNKYVSSRITYDFDYKKEVIDRDQIHKWLSADKKYRVTIDKTKIRAYMEKLGNRYNTVGKTRTISIPGGGSVTVSGGTYGWRLNQVDETEKLHKLIKSGSVKERRPLWLQEGLQRDKKGRDVHDTFILISTGSQYMWFYKNGSLMTSTSVVTGDPTKGRSTPSGTYSIAYKQRNHTLRGDNYASFVNYWLPFYEYRGIGIHDASWRNSYGGSIYRGNGSHGCVNTPYGAVQYIYENVEPGTPVIVY